jgi:hypothetical protein
LSARSAAYWFELDAWTEYWDLYHPETRGLYHFGDDGRPGHLSALLPPPGEMRAPVFDAWRAAALACHEPEPAAEAQRAFAALVSGEAEQAARALDELVRRILHAHFGRAVDVEAYFDAVEGFATDTLPPIPERTALLAPDDARVPSSGRHMLAGDIMWFAWALQLECAQLVLGADGEADRALLMAGVVLGCALDYAHTGRCRTRRAYRGDGGRRRVWEQAHACVGDFSRGAAEVRELFYIRAYDEP